MRNMPDVLIPDQYDAPLLWSSVILKCNERAQTKKRPDASSAIALDNVPTPSYTEPVAQIARPDEGG